MASGRRFVREVLGYGHPALDKVTLGVSELATNAIKHTPSGQGGEIAIRIIVAGSTIRVEVTNAGNTMSAKPRARKDTAAEEGRGILIIEALADAWGITQHTGRTTVWAEFWAGGWARDTGIPAARLASSPRADARDTGRRPAGIEGRDPARAPVEEPGTSALLDRHRPAAGERQ